MVGDEDLTGTTWRDQHDPLQGKMRAKGVRNGLKLTLIGLTQYRLDWTNVKAWPKFQVFFHMRYPMTMAGAVEIPPKSQAYQ